MIYPEWAPQNLVELHKRRMDGGSLESKFKTGDPETVIADLMQTYEGNITKENVEDIRRSLYRKSFGLPYKEGTELLKLLITDLRMKDVWKSLIKRAKSDQDFPNFFRACEWGITGWRGDMRQTPSERRAFYQEIRNAAGLLQSLLNKASGFDYYSINNLVDDQQIEWLLEVLNAPNDVSYARFSLSDITPSILEVLNDIGKKASQYAEDESSVKKPNSRNAELHYFIRFLSGHCERCYGQPLHDVVTVTTSVIVDQWNIDNDYVRKIVKG
ncbi:hypothetical protein C8R31_106189 [Nitrosospira sp. Nsp2]|uniref:hypothetical protein n=1 Tax=Nitrosospira sp. Nsp2 TaxID=136548 RepID=UPI000D304D83|nr:hypothetical protein [Nitrosospira sp. Nsp2]PTR14515.1 hypothetical protein C8R31_106189 [Nitrosospira sp. Nsp2]